METAPAHSHALQQPEVGAPTSSWTRGYVRHIVLGDVIAVAVAGIAALLLRFGGNSPLVHQSVSYYLLTVLIGVAWLGCLGLGRCYEMRYLADGPEEYKRIGNASLRLFGVLGFTAFAAKSDIARGFVLLFFPLGVTALMTGRWMARLRLARAREDGRDFHRVVVVGRHSSVLELVNQLERDKRHGFRVVGVCVSGGDRDFEQWLTVPVVHSLADVRQVVERLGADTVAVAGSPDLSVDALRHLTYDLDECGVDLLVAPVLLNVTGNRISVRPIAGIPLLHVDEPELDGARKLVKNVFDRSTALLMLLLMLPVLLGLMAAVRLTSRGPALFRQTRVGRDGVLFPVLKLRTMHLDAEERLHELQERNEFKGGVLFKIKDDPRITPLGRWLRRWSLDELPQVLNVLMGQMSMVGPRPPLPTEVEKYEGHAHRRLLVKPGITGLWQVSGRSDLSWDEAVRLDLQYVENWSLGLDLVVLAKTLLAVLRSSGAY